MILRLATAALCSVSFVFALVGEGARAAPSFDTRMTSPAAANLEHVADRVGDRLFYSPDLDPMAVMFAYDKLSGNQPDFDSYAQRTQQYLGANSFDQQEVYLHEKARLTSEFSKLNPDATYTIRVNVQLHAYDSSAGGFSIDWNPSSYIPFQDPVNYSTYAVLPTNIDDFTLIPMATEDAAREFARVHNLSTSQNYTTPVLFDVVLKLTSTLPSDNANIFKVGATIVAVRFYDQSGHLLYQSPISSKPRNPAPVAYFANIQGFKLGMSFTDADKIASSKWSQRLFAPSLGNAMYVNGFTKDRSWFACGSINNMTASDIVTNDGGTFRPDFSDCIAFQADKPGPDGVLNAVYSDQILSATRKQILSALISKYGQPTDGESIPLGQTEADFSWILPDAANSSTMSKIDAGIVPLGGTDPRSHLTMELVPFVNPHTPQPSAAMEQPKL